MSESINEDKVMLKGSRTRAMLLFILCSLAGIACFFFKFQDVYIFEILYKTLKVRILGDLLIPICIFSPPVIFIGWFYSTKIAKKGRLYEFFKEDPMFQVVMYVVATVIALMIYFQVGIEALYDQNTGVLVLEELVASALTIIPVAGAIMPLFAFYGLVNFTGAFLEPIMRPAFNVPGKSVLDCITSILTAAVAGMYLTSTLYKNKQYTVKEAVIITSSFSINSIGFCIFLVGIVGLVDKFSIIFLMYFAISFIMAAILGRIYPIKNYPDTYADGTEQTEKMRKDNCKFSGQQIKKGFEDALIAADEAGNPLLAVGRGFIEATGVTFKILPMMFVFGTIGMAIFEFTPVFDILSKPLVPIISILGVPEAGTAAVAILTGLLDIVIPVIVASGASVPSATGFFVVMVSMLQILYLSETILPMIMFGIPVKLKDVCIITILRFFIAMPFAAVCMHLLY